MGENKLLAEYLFNIRKNTQTYIYSWMNELLEPNTWELSTHKKFLEIADKLLSITDYETARKIIELRLFDIE